MRKKGYIFLIISITCFYSCHSQTVCKTIPEHFTSYDEAIKNVKNAKFKISECVNTSKSSWIESAHYYSCDSIIGYFIIQTHSKEYIYKSMPIKIWYGFKQTVSYGSYYDVNIKKRYQLYISYTPH